MMTKNNFEAIAEAIKVNVPSLDRRDGVRFTDDVIRKDTAYYIASDLADVFADDNPNFDRDRFMKACGF